MAVPDAREVLEKGGVNWSAVDGELEPEFAKQFDIGRAVQKVAVAVD